VYGTVRSESKATKLNAMAADAGEFDAHDAGIP
jgi:hypothetical protein